MEVLIVGIVAVILLAGGMCGPVALWWVARLKRRVDLLEKRSGSRVAEAAERAGLERERAEAQAIPAKVTSRPPVTAVLAEGDLRPAWNWEVFLGRKALGWVAIVLLLFGVAFFLRYAFENDWLGPMGQVALGILAGAGLVIFGWWCERFRAWGMFYQIVMAAGLLLLYLSTFAAFGYYSILSQAWGGLFLLLIVIAGGLLAVLYGVEALALMTVAGGLSVPLLMRSAQDLYQQLFLYLTLLNAGLLMITFWRRWSRVSITALVGTHAIFWVWYQDNYHPEKFTWALGFQLALYVLFLAHSMAAHVIRPRRANSLDLVRFALTALAWYATAYILMSADYEPWLGPLAVAMAAVYTAWARITLWQRSEDARQTVVALAVAVSFAAVALPIEADARWVALGWAAEAAALWWFGLRVRAGYPLRGMACVLAVLAVGRVLLVDTPWETREPFLPLVNAYALPSLGVAGCVIGSVLATARRPSSLSEAEHTSVGVAGLIGVLLVWIILSVETYGYFDAYAALDRRDADRWRWLGQVALSGVWAVYASAILTIGFWKDAASLRWTALLLYALTIAKVLLSDMAGLDELYRIGVFIVVAIILAAAAWAYQRFTPATPPHPSSMERP